MNYEKILRVPRPTHLRSTFIPTYYILSPTIHKTKGLLSFCSVPLHKKYIVIDK